MATQPHGDHDGRDGIGDSPRPSFTKFWKRLKSKPAPRRNNNNFVSVNPAAPDGRGRPHDGGEGEGGDASKAEARRAQVRRAQIQHRERKANYAKGLEADVVRLRGDIERCRTDCRELAGDNQGMRQRLTAYTGCATSPPTVPDNDVLTMAAPPRSVDGAGTGDCLPPSQGYGGDSSAAAAAASPYSFNFDPGCMVSLNDNESLGLPSFQAHWGSTASHEVSAGLIEANQTLDLASGERRELVRGSLEETDKAINFVLALEHTCWDHFKAADFQLHDTNQPLTLPADAGSVTNVIDNDPDHGHTLMLSAVALQQAPEPVVRSLENRTATCGAASSTDEPPRAPSRAKTDGSIAWPVTGLTLESLHGLASALNPPDLELTPVQAWFEMVREYGLRAVLEEDNDGSVLDRLVAELRGVVKCLNFGAVIERDAFDSVLRRVLGEKGPGGQAISSS